LQNETQKAAITEPKPRTPWEKEGKYRYLHRKLDQIREEIREGFQRQEARFRLLLTTLSPFLEDISKDYVQQIVCRDEGDEALLAYLVSKGDLGITPAETCAAKELARFHFKPWHITRRMQRMNKRLKTELDKALAESYGRRWVITSFALKAWSAKKEEIGIEEEEKEAETEF